MIELMFPGSKKIELFARNNNLRYGWFSLGNQLGDLHKKWINIIDCDECKGKIYLGTKRYKSKVKADYDLCEKCFREKKLNVNDFYFLHNNVTEDVLHKYRKCNNCKNEPIWGIKFTCKDCPNYDLCECNTHLFISIFNINSMS